MKDRVDKEADMIDVVAGKVLNVVGTEGDGSDTIVVGDVLKDGGKISDEDRLGVPMLNDAVSDRVGRGTMVAENAGNKDGLIARVKEGASGMDVEDGGGGV